MMHIGIEIEKKGDKSSKKETSKSEVKRENQDLCKTKNVNRR